MLLFQNQDFEFESELTSAQHMIHETYSREVETTLPLDVRAARSKNIWSSDWTLMPTHTEENNTRWEVQFIRDDDDVGVGLRWSVSGATVFCGSFFDCWRQ